MSIETPKQYSEADIIEHLKSLEGQGVRYKESKVEIPETRVNPEEFKSDRYPDDHPRAAEKNAEIVTAVEEILEKCKTYLKAPTITDTIVDHSDRRRWRMNMDHKFGVVFSKVYDRNKLRVNNVAGLYNSLNYLALELRRVSSEKAATIKNLIANLPDTETYDTTADKMEFISKIDEFCAQFIALFAEKK